MRRNLFSPKMSKINRSTKTSPSRGFSNFSLFLDTIAPRVRMYLRSKVSETNGRTSSVFPQLCSPTRHTFAFIRGGLVSFPLSSDGVKSSLENHDIPFKERKFPQIKRSRIDREEKDPTTQRHQLVQLFDEEEDRHEAVVDHQVLQTIEEDHTFTVVVLDELPNHLHERAGRRRVVMVFAWRVAQPDHPYVGQASIVANTVRVGTGNEEAGHTAPEHFFEDLETEGGPALFDQTSNSRFDYP